MAGRHYGRGWILSPVQPRGWAGYEHPVDRRSNRLRKKVRPICYGVTLKRLQREGFEAAAKARRQLED